MEEEVKGGRRRWSGGGGGGREEEVEWRRRWREDLSLVGGLVTLNECRYQLRWGEVFAHVYPGVHCLGCTLTHEGWRELVEEGLKPFEATATLLREEEGREREREGEGG